MATTTNFGWETPDNTDAVTNGALAIRTLAGEIDTTVSGLVSKLVTDNQFTPAPQVSKPQGGVAKVSATSQVLLVPFTPNKNMTLTQISVRVVATATATGYMGIYSHDPVTNTPSTLIADFGSFSASTSATKSITISQAVTAGTKYWLALKPNNTTVTFYGVLYDTANEIAAYNSQGDFYDTNYHNAIYGTNAASGALTSLTSAAIALGNQGGFSPQFLLKATI